MLDKLIDLIIQFLEDILPFVIIPEYKKGVVLRFGKYKKTMDGGIHFKIPFFDNIIQDFICTTTLGLHPQSVTTRDGKSIVVRGIIKYKIFDIHNYTILVYDSKDAMSDTTMGIIKETINERDWEDVQKGKIDNLISKRVIKAMEEYGIEVEKLTLTDMAEMKSIRLFTNANLADL